MVARVAVMVMAVSVRKPGKATQVIVVELRMLTANVGSNGNHVAVDKPMIKASVKRSQHLQLQPQNCSNSAHSSRI